MATAFAILVLMLAVPAVYATDYTVGDTSSWDTGINYNDWASGKKFVTGDTLLFSYGGLHGVDVVNEDDYKNCNSGNALASYNDGSTKITLSKPGTYYYICPTLGHCTGGMKLAVTVADAATPSTTPATTPPTTPTTPTSPSTGTGSTPTTTTPARPNTTPTQSSTQSGAVGSFKNLSILMVFASLVLAPLLSGLMD